jgi:thiamine pyrophosphate-dependent acetolactate synthase large subunit-like protein
MTETVTTTTSTTTNVSERIIELLEAEGVNTLFGIPDPGFARMHRAAADRGWQVVAPHHESAGAFMADALSRMTGRIQVIVGNQGPGVANLVPAAICAAKEHIPVLFLAGQRHRMLDAQVRRNKFQYTPQPRFFEAGMKYVGVIEFADQVDEVLHEAFRQALSGTPGPVYVEFPQDHVNTPVDLGPAPPPERYRLVHQRADADAVEAAADLLANAECPILFPGTGVHTSRGHEALERLADVLQCPVIPSWGGLGVLPISHPQVLPYSVGPAVDAVAEADVVLAVGTAIGEPLHYGTGRHWAKGNTDRKWIHIERDPQAIGVNRSIDIPLMGDLRDVMPQLTEALERRGPFQAPPKLAEWRAGFEAFAIDMALNAPDTFPVHPGRMVFEATQVLPDDAVMVRDGGNTSLWAGLYSAHPSRDILWSSKFGHLGVGLPYAIGAQLAVGSERRVCLITGDSAFQFHISELETAVRKNLPIVCIVNSDAAWGMELGVFAGAFGLDRDVEVKWGDVRFDKIAEGYGAHGEFVDRTEDVGPAVERALASGRPAVVQVAVDPMVNAFHVPHVKEFATWYTGGYSA